MSSKCPKCEKPVYFAEKVSSMGKDWHKSCLKCTACKKTLTPGKHSTHDGQPYCDKPCYAKLFGPGGYGYGGSVSSARYDQVAGSVPPGVPNETPVSGSTSAEGTGENPSSDSSLNASSNNVEQ